MGTICADAGVTVGALYHHYGDKKGLFAAVAEQVDAQLVQQAANAQAATMASGGTPWDAFLASIDTVLQAGANAPLRRLMLVEAPAVLGAQVIEKHFTLDRTLLGPDHQASLEPDELKQMVEDIRALQVALGDGCKAPQPSEWDTRQAARPFSGMWRCL